MPDREQLYSDEANEIMGRMPSWIIRWGITVVFAIFVGILLGCYFIRYPETVTAPIVLTTVNPPADLVVRYDGLIDSIYVRDGQYVKPGTVVAVIANPADYRVVEKIGRRLTASVRRPFTELVAGDWLDEEYELGALQAYYADFRSRCLDYRHYLAAGRIAEKRRLLEQQIAKNREYYDRLRLQHGYIREELRYERNSLRRDSLLMAEHVISSADYETSMRSMLQKQGSEAAFNATLASTELNIIQSEQQLIELAIQQEDEVAEYERSLSKSREELLAQIAAWKSTYVLEAPVGGRVTLINYWNGNQHVSVGEKLASIVPAERMEVLGRMHVPSSGFGKVEVGQGVNVKLNGYPYMEFGVMKGVIRTISAIPDGEKGYVVEVIFPNGMTTSYNKELMLIQRMDGEGEIITKEMRLIERFIQPIRALFNDR